MTQMQRIISMYLFIFVFAGIAYMGLKRAVNPRDNYIVIANETDIAMDEPIIVYTTNNEAKTHSSIFRFGISEHKTRACSLPFPIQADTMHIQSGGREFSASIAANKRHGNTIFFVIEEQKSRVFLNELPRL